MSEYPPSRRVQTSYGVIEGRRLISDGEKMVDAFQGIPYAAPPIGPLRFKPPTAHPKWDGVRETKAFGYRGIQIEDRPVDASFPAQSEDNLTMNVFTPVWDGPENGFAVIVYIHGGGFVIDSAVKYGDKSICEHLVMKDVVVVTIQYRLGYLGFWTTGDDECEDNLGLRDMTFALEWIKITPRKETPIATRQAVINIRENGMRCTEIAMENACSFNGDPNNITIMGQSAGGCSVDLLSLSPMSRNLFHKIIPMAGCASCDWCFVKNPLDSCRQRAYSIGITDDGDSKKWLEELRQVDAPLFADRLRFEGTRTELFAVGPKYDKHFLPKSLQKLRSEAPMKPRLIGCARSEGLILFDTVNKKNNNLETLRDIISDIIPESEHPVDYRKLQNDIVSLLFDPKSKSEEDWDRAIVEALGDFFQNVGIQKNILDVLEYQPSTPIYFYSFDYCNPKCYGEFGKFLPFIDASHCSDISYVVGNHIVNQCKWSEDDLKMIDITTRLWTNFAKYGDPNGNEDALNGVVWRPATTENPQLNLSLSLTPKLEKKFKSGRPLVIAEVKKRIEKSCGSLD